MTSESHPSDPSGAVPHPAPPAPAYARRRWLVLSALAGLLVGAGIVLSAKAIGGAAAAPARPTPAPAGKAQRKILYWWDPMLGPSSIRDHPGQSAMGMDLVPVYANTSGAGAGAGAGDALSVHIDPTVVQNMGVRTATVTRGPLTQTISTVGEFRLPETGLYDVTVKVNGWIDKLYADQEGMHVQKGAPLFALYSPDLQIAQQELISAVHAQKALDGTAGEAVRQEIGGLVESAQRKLRLWDVAEQDITAIAASSQPTRAVIFRSPANGHIEEKMVVQGTAVQAGMKLMRIADHSTTWLDAHVYAQQLPFIKLGQKVEATVDGIPGKTFRGQVTFIYPHLDHMSRTLIVRTTFANAGFDLKPGMYATVHILTQPVPDAVQVPREAVLDTGDQQIVFVTAADGHFDPRPVRMGVMGDEGMVQIVTGLAPGQTVVTSGQFLMDVESRTTEAIQKMRAQ